MGSMKIKWLSSAGAICAITMTNVYAAPQTEGKWSSVVNWPTIAVHSILTPQGKVMSFGTDENGVQGAQFFYDVWNPDQGTGANSHNTLTNTLGVDSFCSAAVLMPETGNVLMSGGDNRPNGGTNNGINDAPIFNTSTNSLSRAADMNSARWYPTSTVLPNGEILLSGGRDTQNRPVNTPEIYSPGTNKWRSLLGISTAGQSPIYPRQWVAPNGNIFGYFNGNRMFSMNTAGNGSLQLLGNLPTTGQLWLSSGVMYRPGKILHVGGVNDNSNATLVIDINGSTPNVRAVSRPSETGRVLNTSVVLPNGKVMVVGGSKVYNQLNGTSYRPEIWDPATEAWSKMASAVKARLYHSTALLLKDGRVLVAGGGAPGPQVNTNAEIFSPPYLFNNSGQAASRPNITSAPAEAPYGSKVAVRHNPSNVISRATLIKTGAVTHSTNMEQRFIELDFKDINNGVSVTLPNSANIAPPGYYLLHLLDNKGVPSKAHIIRISSTAQLNIGPYPVAVADTATSNNGETISISPLTNDIGNGRGLVEVNRYTEEGGTTSISGNKIVYTPKSGFTGTDVFWYVMEDDQGRLNAAQVTITVTAGNSAPYPVAKADNYTTLLNTAKTLDVLANDTPSGAVSIDTIYDWTAEGGRTSKSNGKISYTPKPNFTGEDNFWYVIVDSQGRKNSTQVKINVTAGNSNAYPVANPDIYTTARNTAKTLDVLANDTPAGAVSIDTIYDWTAEGGRTSISNGKINYVPKTNFTGQDNFWYVMVDSQGRKNSTQVKINVQ